MHESLVVKRSKVILSSDLSINTVPIKLGLHKIINSKEINDMTTSSNLQSATKLSVWLREYVSCQYGTRN